MSGEGLERGKLKFIHVRGTDREIGRQHAEQMRLGFRESMAGFYFDLWSYIQNVPLNHPVERAGLALLKHGVFPSFRNRLLRGVPAYARDRLTGMAEVLGVPVSTLQTTLLLPDLLPALQTAEARFRPARYLPVRDIPALGCSSALVSERSMLHARNLDFPGMGFWDRAPVLQLTEVPGRQRVLSFTTESVPIGGVTAVNESQLSICLHQHYSRTFSLSGRLPLVIAEEALQRFSKLEEMVEYLVTQKVSTSWAYLVCDGKTKRAAIVEKTSAQWGVTWLLPGQTPLVHTNFFQTERCRADEYSISLKMIWDNRARYQRFQNQLEDPSRRTPLGLARILSDHWDPYWGETKSMHRTIAQPFNIQSVVLDLSSMRAHVAEGPSPVHLGEMVEYDLGEAMEGRTPTSIARNEVCDLSRDPNASEAKKILVQAFIQAFARDFERANVSLRRVNELAPTAETYFAQASMQLKLRAFEDALASIERAISWLDEQKEKHGKNDRPPEYFEVLIKRAQCLDLLGRRNEALETYARVAGDPLLGDEWIRAEAKRARQYSVARLDRLLVPFSTYFPSD